MSETPPWNRKWRETWQQGRLGEEKKKKNRPFDGNHGDDVAPDQTEFDGAEVNASHQVPLDPRLNQPSAPLHPPPESVG